jgi:hypothetical protein
VNVVRLDAPAVDDVAVVGRPGVEPLAQAAPDVRVVPPGLLRRIVLRARPGSAILARAPHDVDATDFDAQDAMIVVVDHIGRNPGGCNQEIDTPGSG